MSDTSDTMNQRIRDRVRSRQPRAEQAAAEPAPGFDGGYRGAATHGLLGDRTQPADMNDAIRRARRGGN
ncbi:hypothetical protein BH23ACT9_BH23ACT9_25540 [soil metagenome]